MTKAVYIAIALIVIILLWIAFYYYKHAKAPTVISETFADIINSTTKKYEEYTKTPVVLYESTVGYVRDGLVDKIHKKAVKREKMYAANEKGSGISDKNYADSIENAFVLGNLYRYHIDAEPATPDPVETYYTRALNRIVERPNILHNPEYIVDRIEDYLHVDTTNIREMLTETRRLNARQAAERAVRITDVPYTTRPVEPEGGHLFGTTNVNQAERDIYYDIQPVRNDPQNVHEPNVVHELKTIYDRIRYSSTGKDNIAKIEKLISDSDMSAVDKTRAKATLKTMSNKNYVSSMNTDETTILNNVYDRIMAPENSGNRDNLTSSLVRSLAECMERGWQGEDQQVCTTGRVSRVIGSLTLGDASEEISHPPVTTEILRNEIFSKSYAIITDMVRSADPDVALAYNGQLENPSPDLDERLRIFENNMRDKIEETVRHDYPNTKPEVLNNIILEAQGGV